MPTAEGKGWAHQDFNDDPALPRFTVRLNLAGDDAAERAAIRFAPSTPAKSAEYLAAWHRLEAAYIGGRTLRIQFSGTDEKRGQKISVETSEGGWDCFLDD